jgi:predicted nucleic acid-binding protein
MILVDTSVIIDYARGKDAKLIALLPTLPVIVCGIVRAELLCGARDPKHRGALLTLLAAYNHLAIPDSIWDTVGDNLAALRSQGITVPFPDAVIATLGIDHNLDVWARDPHFPMMQKVLPTLKLFQEPP